MSTSATSTGGAVRALYRALLRTARKMPDDHRTAFVVHRTRSEFDCAQRLREHKDILDRIAEGHVYREQLELQAQHLSALAKEALLIPVDLRAPPPPSPSPPSTPPSTAQTSPDLPKLADRPAETRRGPTRPPRRRPPPQATAPAPFSAESDPPPAPLPSAPPVTPLQSDSPAHPLDRRKLVRAIAARTAQTRIDSTRRNRFMEGPEPSWVRRRRSGRNQAEGEEEAVPAR
ncbi:hypothetical protein JCM8202_003666 [Rhodotorula sphaerocarpa]